MRKLNTSDVFAMARIVRASGVRNELRPLIKAAAQSERPVEDVGIDGFLCILEALAEQKAENAIYAALSGPFEMTPNEVETLPLDQLVEQLKALVAENDLKHFFDCVSRILGKN
jgi:hypothetical protein